MEIGQRVLLLHPIYPAARRAGWVVKAGRRPGFWKVRYFLGAYYQEEFAAARLEPVESFDLFYGPRVVKEFEAERFRSVPQIVE